MRALVLGDAGVSLDTRRAEPVPGEGEVLVRVLRAGICETDLQLIRGYHGFRGVLGHEFVGIALGGRFEGRRVVGEINCSCWTCGTCLAGRPGHCPHRTVVGIVNRDGAFAELIALPERNLHLVPDPVDTDAAVFTEPLAAAFQIPAQLTIAPGDSIVILGDGRLGNLCAQVLARAGAEVTAVGKHRGKLAMLESMGIRTRTIDDPPPRGEADIVVDCTGSDSGLPAALELVRPRGTIVLKTTIAGTQTLSLAPVVVDEVTIVGSRCGPFDRALGALAAGTVHVRPLVAGRFDLSDGVAAIGRAGERGVLKVLLDVA
ncbi:MAG TPA: alcohol dehydrogenase catalytic domain-containing protein [Vicinamibacterales bacterium]|nr:alcohol dehydrogenase catalytic domain-containing protein [Vicinamibacterales bacterium]